ncbi:hypothetical protein D3C74_185480 [compost metagenome]
MDWKRKIRCELLAYNALKVDRRELMKRLAEMDKDIRPSSSRIDGMPRIKGGLPKSIVESAAIRREEDTEKLRASFEKINDRIISLESALDSLNEQERKVIKYSFYDLNIDYDPAQSMGLTKRKFNMIRDKAMHIFYHALRL